MSEMTIHCPHCGEILEADNKLAGKKVQCPTCNNYFSLQISKDSCIEASNELERHKINCPICGQTISANAAICPYCKTIIPTKRGVNHCVTVIICILLFAFIITIISFFIFGPLVSCVAEHQYERINKKIMKDTKKMQKELYEESKQQTRDLMKEINGQQSNYY